MSALCSRRQFLCEKGKLEPAHRWVARRPEEASREANPAAAGVERGSEDPKTRDQAFALFLHILYVIQRTPQKLSAELKNRLCAEGASAWPADQKRHRGRRPGRRRYREVLLG